VNSGATLVILIPQRLNLTFVFLLTPESCGSPIFTWNDLIFWSMSWNLTRSLSRGRIDLIIAFFVKKRHSA